ncbi:MAG TPA: hypothetical protein PLZ86_02785 [bacterium]|nr:hypothetical protein [bacterium]
MNGLFRAVFALLVVFAAAVILVSPSVAQEVSSSSYAEYSPFTLIIMGTRHYSDVDVMRRNVAKIPSVRKLVQTVSSQQHVQFAGEFSGEEDPVISDIKGLAADRFDVRTRHDKKLGFVITLRKIEDDPQ